MLLSPGGFAQAVCVEGVQEGGGDRWGLRSAASEEEDSSLCILPPQEQGPPHRDPGWGKGSSPTPQSSHPPLPLGRSLELNHK